MSQQIDTFAEDRRAGLGGSDFPKLMIPGYKYGSAYDVYLDKIEGSDFQGNAATRRGHYFEQGVARWYSDKTGRALHRLGPETDPTLNMAKVGDEWTLVHPGFPFLRGTPDFLTDLPDLGLECKTHNDRMLQDVDYDGGPLWGPDHSDMVPTAHMIQCQWYMGMTGRRRWDLAVYFVGDKDEFRQYHLTFDPDFFKEMVDVGVAFWNDYVLPRIPPPIDLVPSDRVMGVLIMKGLASGKEIQATPELNQLAQDWADFQAQRLNVVDDEAEIKARFATLMSGLGAAKVKGSIGGKNWSVGAREEKNGTKTNHAAVEAIFYRMLLDRGAATEELEGILADNTIPSHTDAFIQGYFNSINKDRKALRAAMKVAPLAEDLSA
jgi:predicted phage-related endonuclease